MAKKKSTSRTARWGDAAARAEAALSELRSAMDDLEGIRSEYEEWRDNLPENLQSSALADKLNAVCDLELDGALDDVEAKIEEAVGADLPLGFGRD